jgi:hypothetical protein
VEVLKRKKEGTEVISVRVPIAIYRKLVKQRQRANLLGFNFNATLAKVLSRASREIHEQLVLEERRAGIWRPKQVPNDTRRTNGPVIRRRGVA